MRGGAAPVKEQGDFVAPCGNGGPALPLQCIGRDALRSGPLPTAPESTMSDLHELIETLMLKAALTLMLGLVGWAGAVVFIGLATAAARNVVASPAVTWADENAAILALFLTTLGYVWLKLRPATSN